MEMASKWLETADGALAGANDILLRARAITVSGSTGTTSVDSMQALADGVDALILEMVGVANTNYGGRFMFGGGNTGTAPFSVTGNSSPVSGVQFIKSDYNTGSLDATYSQKIEIAAGVTVDISVGRKTFHTDPSGNDSINSVFNTLINLRTGLEQNDQAAVGALLSDIDALTDNLISERAVVGAKGNRIELAQSRGEAYKESLNKVISLWGDTDYAEASALWSSQLAAYQAALAVGAKLIQPSLLDYLR